MSNKLQLTGAELSAIKPLELVENEKIQSKFVELYNSIHGSKHGELILHKEAFNFKRMIAENKALQECTPLSLYGVFLDVAVNGLSLEGGTKPLAYVIARNANVGTKDNPRWEKRAALVVSPYGELVQRMRAEQIRHADNPIIVYEGDIFEPYIDDAGNKKIRYSAKIPRESKTIIAAFIKITRIDGSVDFEYLTVDDLQRLANYSDKNNNGKGANKLYTSDNGQIDAGFLAGKMIKHAFRTFPKVRTRGTMTITEDDIEPQQQIDYGVDMTGQSEGFTKHEDVEDMNAESVNTTPENSKINDNEIF